MKRSSYPLEKCPTVISADEPLDLSAVQASLVQAMNAIDQVPPNEWRYFRNLLNDFDFEHRDLHIGNRAYYKLWEILRTVPDLIPSETTQSLHLAEAPGSFVQVMLDTTDFSRIVAISQHPMTYAHVLMHGRSVPTFFPSLLHHPRVLCMYSDLVMDPDPLSAAEKCNEFLFITADGGVDDQDGDYLSKENAHIELITAEINFILRHQEVDGSCVLKVFDTFLEETRALICQLVQWYAWFDIVKPWTSRPTNSERYIVCKQRLREPSTVDVDKIESIITNSARDIAMRQIESIWQVIDAIDTSHTRLLLESESGVSKKYYPRARQRRRIKAAVFRDFFNKTTSQHSTINNQHSTYESRTRRNPMEGAVEW